VGRVLKDVDAEVFGAHATDLTDVLQRLLPDAHAL
jgi:hypothetical protein